MTRSMIPSNDATLLATYRAALGSSSSRTFSRAVLPSNPTHSTKSTRAWADAVPATACATRCQSVSAVSGSVSDAWPGVSRPVGAAVVAADGAGPGGRDAAGDDDAVSADCALGAATAARAPGSSTTFFFPVQRCCVVRPDCRRRATARRRRVARRGRVARPAHRRVPAHSAPN